MSLLLWKGSRSKLAMHCLTYKMMCFVLQLQILVLKRKWKNCFEMVTMLERLKRHLSILIML